MKKINLILAFTFSLTMTLGVTAQSTSQETLTTAVGITDVVVSDIPAYVAALKANPQAFRMLGSNFSGFCQAVSGGIPGEALVFSYFDSMEANMAAAEIQLTDASFGRFITTLEPYRELTGFRQALEIRPAGETFENWAIRILNVRVEDQQAYIAALDALERAARANGFADYSLIVQQEIGSGATTDFLSVVAVTSSLSRMGASIDAISSQSWGQSLFANVQAARSQIVGDKIYRCEQIYTAN